MNRNDLQKKWNGLKQKIQEKWHKLSDTDISEIDGDYDQLTQKIQHRYGYSKDQAQRELQNWHAESSGIGQKADHKRKEEDQKWDRQEGNMSGQKNWQDESGQEPRSRNEDREGKHHNKEKGRDWEDGGEGKKRKTG